METPNPELLPTADALIDLQLKALDTISTCKSRKLSGGERTVKMESAWARDFVCVCGPTHVRKREKEREGVLEVMQDIFPHMTFDIFL